MRPPLPFWKEKAESSLSVTSVPETSARPSPGGEQDQHVDVAQRAAAHDRVGDQRERDRQPGDAQGRQFGGEDAGEGEDHEPLEDRAPPALARAAAASGKTSVISTSLRLRRGERGGADRGDDRDRGRHRDQLPPAATQGEHDEAGQPEGDDQDLDHPAGRRAHRLADPAAPHPAHLAGGHRQVAERVFVEVLGEVFLADLAERLVAGQVRVAVGDAVEERRRVDLFERVGVRLEAAVLVLLTSSALTRWYSPSAGR